MATVQVESMEYNRGIGGKGPDGTISLKIIVRSEELGRLTFNMNIQDQGSPDLNLTEARAMLQGFCHKLSEALRQPLAFG